MELTVGEALRVLSPPMPRRTLNRLAGTLRPVGVRVGLLGGAPAKTYRLTDLARLHAVWLSRARSVA